MIRVINGLIFLIICCTIAGLVDIVLALISSRPLFGHNFGVALLAGAAIWLVNILTGRFKDWPIKQH
jgi:hypothetical protein